MGCGSGYLFSGSYYWTQVGLDWRSSEHHRGSLMLCGYSASPEEEGKQITYRRRGLNNSDTVFKQNVHSQGFKNAISSKLRQSSQILHSDRIKFRSYP